MKSQADRILDYMKEHGSITSFDSFTKIGCTRLSARIKELRDRGFNIQRTMISKKNEEGKIISYGIYSLVGEEEKNNG